MKLIKGVSENDPTVKITIRYTIFQKLICRYTKHNVMGKDEKEEYKIKYAKCAICFFLRRKFYLKNGVKKFSLIFEMNAFSAYDGISFS